MKKSIIPLILILGITFGQLSAQANEEQVQVSAVLQYKKLVMQEKKDRATVYNALNLTPEQIEKKENLLCENNDKLEDMFSQLVTESYKLSLMEQVNAPNCEILKQKKIVNNLKNDINCITKKEDKQFKKILNHNQKSKYAMIKKLEKRDSKRDCRQKDYYKSNPGLVPFGGNI